MSTLYNYTVRNAGKSFTTAAVKFIVTNAGDLTTRQIASRLGRTPKSISRKADRLGISLAV